MKRLRGRGDSVFSEGNSVLSKSGIIGGKLAFPSGLVVVEKEQKEGVFAAGKMAGKDAGPVFPGLAVSNLGGGGPFDDGVKMLAIGEDEHSPGETLAFASKFPTEAELNEGGFVADLFDGMEGGGGVED